MTRSCVVKTFPVACGALLTATIATASFQLGRHEHTLLQRSSLSDIATEPTTPFSAPSPDSSGKLSPLRRTEALLTAALAAGHWYPNKESSSLIQLLDSSDLAQLLPKIHAVERRLVRDPLLAELAARWGECDAMRALHWAESLTDQRHRQQATVAIARGWSHASPDTLIAWLNAQPAGSTRTAVLQTTLASLARSRPVPTLDLLERDPRPDALSLHVSAIFRTWAASDPQSAGDRARRIRPESLRPTALHAVIESWSDHEPAEALAFARTLPRELRSAQRANMIMCGTSFLTSELELSDCSENSPVATGRFVGSALGRLAQKDPDAALASVRMLPSGSERERALHDIALTLLDRDPGMATAFAAGLQPGPARSSLLQQIALGYANVDATGAIEWARSLPRGVSQSSVLHVIGLQLAEKDPARAVALVQTLPESSQRSQNLVGIADAWARSDPAAAVAWARSLPESSERMMVIESLAGPWMRLDPNSAIAYVLNQPKARQDYLLQQFGRKLGQENAAAVLEFLPRISDPEKQSQVLLHAVHNLAYRSPEDAATLIARSPSKFPAELIGSVAQNIAANDPVKAIQWMSTLPANNSHTQAVDRIARTWSESDPQSTAQWISTLTPGTTRDAAARGYISTIASSIPDLVAPMALTIQDPSIRNDAIERIARTWIGLDRPAATAWLATAPLTPELRQRYLRR